MCLASNADSTTISSLKAPSHIHQRRLLASSRPSVHLSTFISPPPTLEMSVKFHIEDPMKICSENPDLDKVGQKWVVIFAKYMRNKFAIKVLLCNTKYVYIADSRHIT